MAAPDAPMTLWLTDRSRYKTGTGRCAQQRYLGYHWGPTGYGITSRSDSLPLATGIYAHEGLERFGAILKTTDQLPTLDETRGIIAETRQGYEARVTERGFRGVLGGAHTEETITEQSALISGLLWALRLKFLPWLHQTYQILSVEQERIHLLSCTCGAGPLDAAEHARRGCSGTALMLRNDILAKRRGATTLAYFEGKTTGWESDAWAEQWETDPQLGIGTLDVDQLYGAEVSELYILGMNKGSRRKDKFDPDGRKRQVSSLCYGYRRDGNPPLLAEDWLPAYEWVNDAGEVKRAPRSHKRTGVWELAASDWPVWRAYHEQEPALSPEEFWVRMLPPSVLDKIVFVLGPMNRQDAQIRSVRAGMLGEEQRWQEILWKLYEAQTAGGMGWADERFQTLLDGLVAKSWNCRPFGREHQCEFVGICHREEGWQDPLAHGYQPRLPHHTPETEQAVARGLIAADAALVEEEGDRG